MKVSIIGAGTMGQAMALGFLDSGLVATEDLLLGCRSSSRSLELSDRGLNATCDLGKLTKHGRLLIIAVKPQDLKELLSAMATHFDGSSQAVVSIVAGATIAELSSLLPAGMPIFRVVPNTAMVVRESMTCMAAGANVSKEYRDFVTKLFATVGRVEFLREDLLEGATALCACGIAFFMRAIRAASQGGVEVGFHAQQAIEMAAQTALGAGQLIVANKAHPEGEVDNVTTPQGCTIVGLNRMEHNGFSSAFIKGIVGSRDKAKQLFDPAS